MQTLTLLYWQAPSTLNPYLSGGTKDRDAAALVLEPLANYDEFGQLTPRLAAEIPTAENGGISVDHRSFTWLLRDDVLWSDGTALTADDVVFTWQYCTNPDTGCTEFSAFEDVIDITVINSLSVRITFAQPRAAAHGPFVTASRPVLQKTQFAGCVGSQAQVCTTQNNAPIGTGPYQVAEFLVNNLARYDRNPHYRGATPYFSNVLLKGGGDSASAARAVLETNEADYGWNIQLEPEILDAMQQTGNGQVITAQANQSEKMMINFTNPDPALGIDRSVWKPNGANAHPYLTDSRVVQALSVAIDRSVIAELYGQAAQPACNIIEGPPIYRSPNNNNCLIQDVELAKALLDEASIVDGDGDGWRDQLDGTALNILYQTSTNSVRQKVQALIKEWWAEIGINSTLKNIDAGVFFGGDPNSPNTYHKFYADVEMYTNSGDPDPTEYLGTWLTNEIVTPDKSWTGLNIPRWESAEYDALHQTLQETFDRSLRTDLILQLNDQLVHEGVMIPLVLRGAISVRANELLGVRMNGWDSELWNIADWHRLAEGTTPIYLPLVRVSR